LRGEVRRCRGDQGRAVEGHWRAEIDWNLLCEKGAARDEQRKL